MKKPYIPMLTCYLFLLSLSQCASVNKSYSAKFKDEGIRMTESQSKIVRVAAVQMVSENGNIDKNLSHAIKFVDEAAQKGAILILMPEFMATGYILTKDIWDAGEPKNGPTVQWLKANSKRLGVYIGASFLEAEGEDFFDTFVLTNPDGEEAGRVRKQSPASMEACFIMGEPNSHVIDTKIGRIGIGICYENWLSYIPRLMHQFSVDIMLIPKSSPTFLASGYMKKSIDKFDDMQKSFPSYYAKLLGIPVVCSNKCGPGPYVKFFKAKTYFPGNSAIFDSDGSTKEQLSDQEGVIVEDVTLSPVCKVRVPKLHRGRWAIPVQFSQNISPIVESFFKINYKLNSERKQRAVKISSKN